MFIWSNIKTLWDKTQKALKILWSKIQKMLKILWSKIQKMLVLFASIYFPYLLSKAKREELKKKEEELAKFTVKKKEEDDDNDSLGIKEDISDASLMKMVIHIILAVIIYKYFF
jgi:hypothetical protein